MKRLKYISPFFFTFFFFLKQSLYLHPDYEACVPSRCASVNVPNITYPFFIHGLQNSTCGYPGLELRCTNGFPILQISGNDFRVLDIDYDKWNLRLQSTVNLTNRTVSCFSNIRNLTLDPNRFLINNVTTTSLVFISNCSNYTNASLARYRIRSCGRNVELVMLANDTKLRTAVEICGNDSGIVTIPVELTGEEERIDGTNYAQVLERGFVLQYFATDCGVCRLSGGRCGFNTTAFQFRCFCPDRPHMVSCRPGKNFPFTVHPHR